MGYSYSLQTAKRTVVDIPATSRLLKDLRNKNGFSVKQLQEIFGFETPVTIYAWENEKCKNIPCIENFDILSKLYNCHVEDLYVLKQVDLSDLQVRENTPEYGTYRTLVNRLLEGLADIEEGRVQDFEKAMKEIREELGV
ncbi:helix-turn-helix domain-containing protein [Treponema porcinum]|uniref:helix-turn-helix domain-containing protein n=1 Tax=Treponema porcinum TaxID=261392 RepID=UPI003F067A27